MALRRAEPGVNGKVAVARRSDRFLDGLKDASRVTFVSHVHPDPDSLGSMMGLAHLVEVCLGKADPAHPRRPHQPGGKPGHGRSPRPRPRSHRKSDLGRGRGLRHGGQSAEHRPAQPARERPPLRRHRPSRHARRPGRHPFRGRPSQPGGDLFAGHQLPDGAEHRRAARPGHRPAVRHRNGAERLSPRGQRRSTTTPCSTSIPWRTRTCWPASATPVCRKAISSASSRRCKARSSTTGSSSAGRTTCRSRNWRRRWSIS